MQLMAICHCLSDWYVSQTSSTNSSTPIPFSDRKHCVYVFLLVDPNDENMEIEYINTLTIIQWHMTLILSLHLGEHFYNTEGERALDILQALEKSNI